jgi:RNA polymerase sigma-70 factor (ECF subfamily)
MGPVEPPERSVRPSFEDIYAVEFDYVWSSLRRLGVRQADLEDVAHDLFLVVHRQLERLDPARPVRPWLFGIAYRVASEHRRRAHRHREVLEEREVGDAAPRPDELVARQQAAELVQRALDGIPLERRGIFVLHDIDGYAVPEIATALEVPLNTAYSRLRLARADFAREVARLKGTTEVRA